MVRLPTISPFDEWWCVGFGTHVISNLSSTQPSVTLLSGEAGFYGFVKAAGACFGNQSIIEGGDRIQRGPWHFDQVGIGQIKAPGDLHLVGQWGDVNPADIFTKHVPSKDQVHQIVKLVGCEYRAGRSTAAPLMRPSETGGGQGGPLFAGYFRRSALTATRSPTLSI